MGVMLELGASQLLSAQAEDFDETITAVKAGNQDWIISAAFTTAIIALGAVTLGVSCTSISLLGGGHAVFVD